MRVHCASHCASKWSFYFFLISLFASPLAVATTYSNAENGNDGWSVFDNRPAGAIIRVVTDNARQSRVIETDGDGRGNSYLLGGIDAGSGWNNRSEFMFEWKMATDEPAVVMVYVDTTAGVRRMSYNKSNSDSLKNPANNTIAFGLGSAIIDGAWRTHQRDLARDVAVGEPGNRLLGVNGVLVLGSVRLDDVILINGSSEPTDPPRSVISSSVTAGDAPLTVRFDGSRSSATPPATLTGYLWDFGNGETSRAVSATTTFSEAGSYRVRLTVTDSNDRTHARQTLITVNEGDSEPADPPRSVISSNVTSGEAPLSVRFDGRGSSAVPPATLTGYRWNFGNGQTSNAASPTATFDAAGSYTVRLTVIDSNDLRHTRSTVINVRDGDDGSGIDPADADAARLLSQAAFGATMESIAEVRRLGVDGWIDAQFNQQSQSHLQYSRNHPGSGSLSGPRQHKWMIDAIDGADQLRQRVAFALSEILVTSDVTQVLDREQYAMANYYDILRNYAFGNYRDLLEQVTLNPVMGLYLSMLQNARSDPASNTRADENFAREIMQLFTIGQYELNNNGTVRIYPASGRPIPAYTQTDVEQYARVFTGWTYADADRWDRQPAGGFTNKFLPMRPFPGYHDTGEKRLLGGIVSRAGLSAQADLDIALDSLFNHRNVGPFIGRQLIQRLVTSNPTPAYVGRVASVFNNNGAGVRGDLGAVVRAILLDPEARTGHRRIANYGKLREPLIRWAHLWRAFNVQRGAQSAHGIYNHGSPYIYSGRDFLGQSVLSAASVFNFFRPDYSPPGPVRTANIVAPEAQIYTDAYILTTMARLNSLSQVFYQGGSANSRNKSYIDITEETRLAANPQQLLDRLNLLLLAGQMSSGLRNILLNHMATLDGDEAGRSQRVRDCITLIMASPEYLVQK